MLRFSTAHFAFARESRAGDDFLTDRRICAWPNLTLLPDGTLAAVLFNKPNHSLAESEVECRVSSDGGCLWRCKTCRLYRDSQSAGEDNPNGNLVAISALDRPNGCRFAVVRQGRRRRNRYGALTALHPDGKKRPLFGIFFNHYAYLDASGESIVVRAPYRVDLDRFETAINKKKIHLRR
ncbi:MAG: hypothetical protein K0Q94_6617 [Paenibacillus sp.]|jgi:hypothetical protein|nr:hypothetical protein [Paenibacillus sp.]